LSGLVPLGLAPLELVPLELAPFEVVLLELVLLELAPLALVPLWLLPAEDGALLLEVPASATPESWPVGTHCAPCTSTMLVPGYVKARRQLPAEEAGIPEIMIWPSNPHDHFWVVR
jgi:hypothetical protein